MRAASPDAFTNICRRLVDVITDFGEVRSIFFRDPDGMEGEVLIAKGGDEGA
jgi:hypothetical protein